MKILAINAGHRGDQGYTRFLIDRLFQRATDAGADCEVITLARLKIYRCLACGQCHSDAHLLECVYQEEDDVFGVFRKMVETDLIIYATPVYVFGMVGLLKTFLDRLNATGDSRTLRVTNSGLMFHHINPAICSKPFVVLVCCDNSEDETPRNVLAYFRTFSRFMDAPQVGTLVRKSGFLTGQGKNPDQEEKFSKLRQVYEAFEQAGHELAIEGRISKATQRKANQDIIPVPFYALIKWITFKPFKEKFIEHARLLQETSPQNE